MKFDVKKPKPVQGSAEYWQKKDKDIQIAQSVNLAVEYLKVFYESNMDSERTGTPSKSEIKKKAILFNEILNELKEEL